MLGLAAVPAFIQLILMLFLPESQRWLGKKNRTDDCKKVLERVYENDGAEVELRSIQREVERMRPYIN